MKKFGLPNGQVREGKPLTGRHRGTWPLKCLAPTAAYHGESCRLAVFERFHPQLMFDEC